MKLLFGHKDGGPKSQVQCWGIEIKSLFSVLLLRFTPESREEFHGHAFDCYSWVLDGCLHEEIAESPERYITNGMDAHQWHRASRRGFWIRKADIHRVRSVTPRTWALTFRGPWQDTWADGQPGNMDTLTHGRKKV